MVLSISPNHNPPTPHPPGDRAHRLPVVLQLEPLHHLRHHDVQLQPGKALPDARPVKECFLLSDNLTSTWLHPTSLNLSAFLVVISEDDHQQRTPNPKFLSPVSPDPVAKRKVREGVCSVPLCISSHPPEKLKIHSVSPCIAPITHRSGTNLSGSSKLSGSLDMLVPTRSTTEPAGTL